MLYQYSGVFDQVTDPSGLLQSAVEAGSGFSGTFTFDSEAPDSSPYTSIGFYAGPSFSSQLFLGPYSWYSGAENGFIGVENDSRDGDVLDIGCDSFLIASDISVTVLGVYLVDGSGAVFSSDALPMNPVPFSAFNERGLHVEGIRVSDGATFKLWGTLDSFVIVPEPCTILLVVIGLIAGQHRKR
jgi:hypothetical protein